MVSGEFYRPDQVRPIYNEIVPVYQSAFAGEPWYEVSKCADQLQRCVGGLSALAVGQMCELCGTCTERPAYEPDELIDRFDFLADTRPTDWYIERGDQGLTLAAIAWQAPVEAIASEKYADVPQMGAWMTGVVGDRPIVWLDEVFANRLLQAGGNLRRFRDMCDGFMDRLDTDTLAYRTVNERMTTAAKRNFTDQATIFGRDQMVPDRRDFVVIRGDQWREQ